MTANAHDLPSGRGKSLEDEFFHREDQRLLDDLRRLRSVAEAREALAKAAGTTNPVVLDKLTKLGIRAETAAALRLVPLVEVAWADGSLDDKERQAVLTGAREAGFAADSTEYALLEAWLGRRPEANLLTAWTHQVEGMCEQLTPEDVVKLRSGLLDRARAVARASGGVLGLGSKISSAEAAMLKRLEAAFTRTA